MPVFQGLGPGYHWAVVEGGVGWGIFQSSIVSIDTYCASTSRYSFLLHPRHTHTLSLSYSFKELFFLKIIFAEENPPAVWETWA